MLQLQGGHEVQLLYKIVIYNSIARARPSVRPSLPCASTSLLAATAAAAAATKARLGAQRRIDRLHRGADGVQLAQHARIGDAGVLHPLDLALDALDNAEHLIGGAGADRRIAATVCRRAGGGFIADVLAAGGRRDRWDWQHHRRRRWQPAGGTTKPNRHADAVGAATLQQTHVGSAPQQTNDGRGDQRRTVVEGFSS